MKPENCKLIEAPQFPRDKAPLARIQHSCSTARLPITRSLASGTYEVHWSHPLSPDRYCPLLPPQNVLTLPPGSRLRVVWRDPALEIDPTPQQLADKTLPGSNDFAPRVGGTLEFEYYDPASLAMEVENLCCSQCGFLRTLLDHHLSVLIHSSTSKAPATVLTISRSSKVKFYFRSIVLSATRVPPQNENMEP